MTPSLPKEWLANKNPRTATKGISTFRDKPLQQTLHQADLHGHEFSVLQSSGTSGCVISGQNSHYLKQSGQSVNDCGLTVCI